MLCWYWGNNNVFSWRLKQYIVTSALRVYKLLLQTLSPSMQVTTVRNNPNSVEYTMEYGSAKPVFKPKSKTQFFEKKVTNQKHDFMVVYWWFSLYLNVFYLLKLQFVTKQRPKPEFLNVKTATAIYSSVIVQGNKVPLPNLLTCHSSAEIKHNMTSNSVSESNANMFRRCEWPTCSFCRFVSVRVCKWLCKVALQLSIVTL